MLSQTFQKSATLEAVLNRINTAITDLPGYQAEAPQLPLLLIFGCPRSGTTLLMQWLASLGCLGYPSNLVARFFGNPAFGFDVQKALVEFDKENQIGIPMVSEAYRSQLGRTSGATAPSEFWYFWRRYFVFQDAHQLSESELFAVDSRGLLADLGAMESAAGKPLVMKAMLMNWHIEWLMQLCPHFLAISTRRRLFDVAQSVLLSRETYGDSRSVWWSFKPPAYREWLDRSPIEQVAAQVVHIQSVVDGGMQALPSERKLAIVYDDFCSSPHRVYQQLSERYARMGYQLPELELSDHRYDARCRLRLSQEEASQLCDALRREADAINLEVDAAELSPLAS